MVNYNTSPKEVAIDPQVEYDLMILLWENCKRHITRWLKTGKRPTAADDLDKFDTKFYEVMNHQRL